MAVIARYLVLKKSVAELPIFAATVCWDLAEVDAWLNSRRAERSSWHYAKGDGQEYITGKGHSAEQIDDIIANPRPDLSGFIEGRGQFRGQDIRLLTGSDGHWVQLDQNGNVRATSNRNLPLSHKENYPGDIIRPLE